ncbi:hypothetical protein GcC1_147021 [Golovinomyces cichoracearum]|uniref:Uncharacterized protein n=1 Tax=Golovinomyces cichoracearum TaxID=62708 RepID=A0A420HYF0_9PEZI|nr:hypothetical protein GcC1_147021 [Golovinomyces cichoracearum]
MGDGVGVRTGDDFNSGVGLGVGVGTGVGVGSDNGIRSRAAEIFRKCSESEEAIVGFELEFSVIVGSITAGSFGAGCTSIMFSSSSSAGVSSFRGLPRLFRCGSWFVVLFRQ